MAVLSEKSGSVESPTPPERRRARQFRRRLLGRFHLMAGRHQLRFRRLPDDRGEETLRFDASVQGTRAEAEAHENRAAELRGRSFVGAASLACRHSSVRRRFL